MDRTVYIGDQLTGSKFLANPKEDIDSREIPAPEKLSASENKFKDISFLKEISKIERDKDVSLQRLPTAEGIDEVDPIRTSTRKKKRREAKVTQSMEEGTASTNTYPVQKEEEATSLTTLQQILGKLSD